MYNSKYTGCGHYKFLSHLCDLHNLDGGQLARLDVPALVDLAIGTITHNLY